MQLVSALLFSLPPPLGRNPQIKPRVELQMRGVSCLGGREKGVGGGGADRRLWLGDGAH